MLPDGCAFSLHGFASLKIKETDRITALRQELGKLGFEVQEANDAELFWEGDSRGNARDTEHGGKRDTEHDGTRDTERGDARDMERGCLEPIDTYEDHRMAMCFAPAAMCLGRLRIHEPQVVSKSYPRFWEELRKAGFKVTERSVKEE